MLQYIVKRILVMVPTFLAITVLVFVIINMAPGDPGRSQNSSGSEQADQSANAREGYRLFKEQYALDQPVLLNFRFTLSEERVRIQLEAIARNMAGATPGEAEALAVGNTASLVLTGLLNTEYSALDRQLSAPGVTPDDRDRIRTEMQNLGYTQVDPIRPARPPQGDVYNAEERVENWGNVIVPFLISTANEYVHITPIDAELPWMDGLGVLASDLGIEPADALLPGAVVEYDGETYDVNTVLTQKVRFLAVQRLSVNARRRVLIGDGEQASTPEQAALNAEISLENSLIAQLTYDIDASSERQAEVVGAWNEWFGTNEDRFQRSALGTLEMMFFHTRFARYWSNLSPIAFGRTEFRLPWRLGIMRFKSPNLGTSLRYRRPAAEVIGEKIPYSLTLAVLSLLLAYFISVPLGILAAIKRNQFADRGIGVFLFILYSLPSFFVGTLLATYMTDASNVEFMSWFPVSGWRESNPAEVTTWQGMWDVTLHLVLPVVCLTYGALAVLSRYARTGLLDVINSDYIRTARAKGLSEWVVILKHAVRNGMIPILTLLGTTLPYLVSGSIVIETIFVIDGTGSLMLTAIMTRDYNIIMGILLITSILTLVGILLSDISYALVDPRISFD